jgi:hypothetical protein
MVVKYPGLASKALFVDLMAAGSGSDSPATRAQVDAWVTKFKTTYVVVKDPEGVTGFPIRTTISDRKTMFLVEWSTMKILHRSANVHDATWAKLGTLE